MWKLKIKYNGDLNILSNDKKISTCNIILLLVEEGMKEFLYAMHNSGWQEWENKDSESRYKNINFGGK